MLEQEIEGGGWFKAPLIFGKKGESVNTRNEAILEGIKEKFIGCVSFYS